MNYLYRKFYIVLLVQVYLCSPTIHAQEIHLNDWNVIDPWEEFCVELELNDAEEKLLINIGSKAFTWLTGTKEQAEYEPIGELANYFGFAKMRNEIRDSSDNPLADENLRGSSWLVVLENLESNQRQTLYDLAIAQEYDFASFLEERVKLINEFYGLKEDENLNLRDAINYTESMCVHEGIISIISADGFGEVSGSLNDNQQHFFTQIRAGELIVSELVGTGPYTDNVTEEIMAFSSFQKELLKETASKFLSYETGNLADAIFLPSGKIGNFFGFAHYRYEERAVVNRNQAFELLTSVLTEDQEKILACLTKQVYHFEQEYISAREKLITELYPLKEGNEINKDLVLQDYIIGASDEGKLGTVLAIYFDFLERSLSNDQIEELKLLRETTGEGTSGSTNITEVENDINIHPNPFNDNLNILSTGIKPGSIALHIFNLQGQLISKTEYNLSIEGPSLSVDTSIIPRGSYFYIIKRTDDFVHSLLDSGYIIKI